MKESSDKTYFSVSELQWNDHQLKYGKSVKVKDLGLDVKLFKVVVSTDRTDFVLNND